MTRIPLRNSTLRSWREDDAPSMAQHFNSRAVWLNLRDEFPHPYTIEVARERLTKKIVRPEGSDLAIEVDGSAVGSIGLTLQVTSTPRRPASRTTSAKRTGDAAS